MHRNLFVRNFKFNGDQPSNLSRNKLEARHECAEMSSDEFRHLGTFLVDQLASYLDSLPERPVSPQLQAEFLQTQFHQQEIPESGNSPQAIIEQALKLVIPNSVHTGNPRFWGYVCSSAAPIGALAEFLSSMINSNVASSMMAPIGTAMELQTIRWIGNLLGFHKDCGGILVSGGNMANFVGLLAARRSKAPWDIRTEGLSSKNARPLRIYATASVHTWLQKAVDCFGFGMNAIHYVPTDQHEQMIPLALEKAIQADKAEGFYPFLVIGSAGTVARGAVDPLMEIAEVTKKNDLWFHVDGAYGAPAVTLESTDPQMKGLGQADSVAVDPHKWLYVPIEAGCTLVRDPQALHNTFSFSPDYYDFSGFENDVHFYEYGLQNTRSFRALKIWMCLKQIGREGLLNSIKNDIDLSRQLFKMAQDNKELEAISNSLSITNFRFVPNDFAASERTNEYLNQLNRKLLSMLRAESEFYLTNANIDGNFTLRACIVNFRTTNSDLEALIDRVVTLGRALSGEKPR